jgi:hypothetical protein
MHVDKTTDLLPAQCSLWLVPRPTLHSMLQRDARASGVPFSRDLGHKLIKLPTDNLPAVALLD